MKRSAPCRAAGRGFTLVELLVVMMIIGLLITLLIPAVTQAFILVDRVRTRYTIAQLETALAAFHKDWQTYPPSNKSQGGRDTGYQSLQAYLAEGTATGGKRYYQSEEGTIEDSFRPAKSIFYYRAEPAAAVVFDVLDNGLDKNKVDTSGRPDRNFASQAHFEMLVKRADPSGKTRWARPDFLLISAGHDGDFGYVAQDPGSTSWRPASSSDADRKCDDVTNFEY